MYKVLTSHENRHSESYALLGGGGGYKWIYFRTFHIYCPNLMKFGVRDSQITLLSKGTFVGRSTAQAVSRRPLTAEDGFDPGLVHVGFVVDKVALG
jgi:hypothetical protein